MEECDASANRFCVEATLERPIFILEYKYDFITGVGK